MDYEQNLESLLDEARAECERLRTVNVLLLAALQLTLDRLELEGSGNALTWNAIDTGCCPGSQGRAIMSKPQPKPAHPDTRMQLTATLCMGGWHHKWECPLCGKCMTSAGRKSVITAAYYCNGLKVTSRKEPS